MGLVFLKLSVMFRNLPYIFSFYILCIIIVGIEDEIMKRYREQFRSIF